MNGVWQADTREGREEKQGCRLTLTPTHVHAQCENDQRITCYMRRIALCNVRVTPPHCTATRG